MYDIKYILTFTKSSSFLVELHQLKKLEDSMFIGVPTVSSKITFTPKGGRFCKGNFLKLVIRL